MCCSTVPGCTVDERVFVPRQFPRISLQRHLISAFPDSVNFYPSETVPSTLCVVLLRQSLCTSLQRREIQDLQKMMVFNRSQNLLVGLFNVDFNFFVFFRTRALGLQVKTFFGFFSP
ncbi:hypothetical protein Bca4012_081043 [Brassica carinata]